MQEKAGFMLASILLILASLPVCAEDEPWGVLRKITWDRTYLILKRDRQCVDGEITAVSGHNLTVKRTKWTDKKQQTYEQFSIERADILRIGERLKPIDVVYSARSSWTDVKALDDTVPSEYALIVMKDGKRRKVKPTAVSDEALKFSGESDLN